MKYYLILLSILNFGLSLKAQSDVEIVDKYLNYAFSGDWENQEKLLSDNVIDYHPTLLEMPAKGRKALIDGWKATVDSFESMEPKTVAKSELTIYEGELAGDWVLNITEVTALAPAIDKPIRFVMVGLYQLNEGLIIEVRNFGNLLDLYLQMGYRIVPGK